MAKQLTYTENGRTYGLICAWCVEMTHGDRARQEPATQYVKDVRGRKYPACDFHAERAI